MAQPNEDFDYIERCMRAVFEQAIDDGWLIADEFEGFYHLISDIPHGMDNDTVCLNCNNKFCNTTAYQELIECPQCGRPAGFKLQK